MANEETKIRLQHEAALNREWKIFDERKSALRMVQEPAIKAIKKAYRDSAQYRLDQLAQKRSRWSRKLTIAQNKVERIDRELRDYLSELVAEKDGRGGEK